MSVIRRIVLYSGSALGVVALMTAASSAGPTADVVASNWKFTPATVAAHVGVPSTLTFTSSEGVHGIVSTDVGIASTMIVPGKLVSVKFTPKKAGTYLVHCSVVCGAGHDAMALTVTVSP